MHVVTIETPSLGNRSYLVHDGSSAVVIDPQRDLDRVLAAIEDADVTVEAVLETHIHNDYVTGGLALARRTGARYHVAADEDVAFDRVPAHDGDVFKVGTLQVTAVHTPGHTPTHLSWLVEGADGRVAVFTGGSMLYGSVGRTDLISAADTEPLTRAQFRSVRRLAERLDDDVEVLPTHGFGSFCSSGETSGADRSTIGEERRVNQALRTDDEDAFVAELLANADDIPAYYAHMAPRNRSGPDAGELEPPRRVDPAALRRHLHAGDWVVDLRPRAAFAHRHLHGTINVPLDDSAATHVGWLRPWDTPVVLLADEPEQITAMQRQLTRIGIDRPAGQHAGPLDALADAAAVSSYDVVDFSALAEVPARGRVPVLDVRRNVERARSHIAGSTHVPLHELSARLDEVPTGTVWVHCQSGYRASIAASLLDRAGRQVVLVDDDFDRVDPSLLASQ